MSRSSRLIACTDSFAAIRFVGNTKRLAATTSSTATNTHNSRVEDRPMVSAVWSQRNTYRREPLQGRVKCLQVRRDYILCLQPRPAMPCEPMRAAPAHEARSSCVLSRTKPSAMGALGVHLERKGTSNRCVSCPRSGMKAVRPSRFMLI